jgi:HTH-type transcriptional regulator, cell division transcriptional repressor
MAAVSDQSVHSDPTEELEDWGDDAATFGDRLALAREATGMSQAQLAHRMGIKIQTLRNWEENRSEPRANRFQMLAGMLNVSMAWLMSGHGEAPAASPTQNGDEAVKWCAAEARALRVEQLRLAERLGQLEKRLRSGLA